MRKNLMLYGPHDMRRKDREVTNFDEIIKIVDACEIVRLGLADGEYPYIVPVNFACEVQDGQLYLYIHGAMAGRKYELLRRNPHLDGDTDHSLKYLSRITRSARIS